MVPVASCWFSSFGWLLLNLPVAAPIALPPPEEVPEEVLRTEIITEVRSPLTGEPMSAADYAELQAQQQENPHPQLSLPSEARQAVLLLQIRRALRSLWPF